MGVRVGNGYGWYGYMVLDKAEGREWVYIQDMFLCQPCVKPSTSLIGLVTVYYQQRMYHRSIGETRCPITLFIEYFVSEIKKKKRNYKRSILIVDTNKYFNKGGLSIGLNQLLM